MEQALTGSEIAIVGMAGRFPGAQDLRDFWRNLSNGAESIRQFSPAELLAAGVLQSETEAAGYVPARPVIEGVEMFDAFFFGYPPREAELMDPQQRLFLEVGWEALEDSGYDPQKFPGLVGVYAGAGPNMYVLSNLIQHPELLQRETLDNIISVGNDKDYLSTRLSYKLDLRGPSVVVQTACSTSLAAVHFACQGLLCGECDLALAGGVSLRLPQIEGYLAQAGGLASPDGHCRAFDAEAEGTLFGSGVGVVVLARLADAVANGDVIHAVIKGSALCNDGGRKVGFSAPSVEGQRRAIHLAHLAAGVNPASVSYVEAHGTGTPVGDPIEIEALKQAWNGASTAPVGCAIGSVKTNIGHAGVAAGVAGLIKTTLMLKHRRIPAMLHFTRLNPRIDLAGTPFRIASVDEPWPAGESPRRAGVSAFGQGGTNVHVVVEEAPPAPPRDLGMSRPELLVLSAKSSSALEAATDRLAAHLEEHSDLQLSDVAWTLQSGRASMRYRRALVCRDIADAVSTLRNRDTARVRGATNDGPVGSVAFMFSGVGDQYVNMGRELYDFHPVFQMYVDRCAQLLIPILGKDLREVLYPADASPVESIRGMAQNDEAIDLRQALGRGKSVAERQPSALDRVCYAHAATFVTSYAAAQMWMSCGVTPVAMIGHSIGEYVAACLAGVLSLEDALRLVVFRAELISTLPAGAMLAVHLSERELRARLEPGTAISAVNAPGFCVASGEVDALSTLAKRLGAEGIGHRVVNASHAFHSPHMAPIAASLSQFAAGLHVGDPKIPYVSNVTGEWVRGAELRDATYWARHLREPVKFGQGLQRVLDQSSILLEVGPGRTLCSFAVNVLTATDREASLISTIRYAYERRADWAIFLAAVRDLWLAGVAVKWPDIHGGKRLGKVQLPTYPFERQRYWLEPPKKSNATRFPKPKGSHRGEFHDWFYTLSWRRSQPRFIRDESRRLDGQSWLVTVDGSKLGDGLVQALRGRGAEVHVVPPANINELDNGASGSDEGAARQAAYEQLLENLESIDRMPSHCVHLSSSKSASPMPTDYASFERHQRHGLYDVLHLTRALASHAAGRQVRFHVVTRGAHSLLREPVRPEQAATASACKCISQEFLNIVCGNIDLPLLHQSTDAEELHMLLEELLDIEARPTVALRGGERWEPQWESIKLPPERPPTLRQNGVYLITGGLGRIGLTLAKYLAKEHQAKLVLVGRSAPPPSRLWKQLLEATDTTPRLRRRLRDLLELEQQGAEVLTCVANVADEAAMTQALMAAEARFGGINGVIHAAGELDLRSFKPLDEVESSTFDAHFMPKVAGTYVLERVLEGRSLDFRLLTSSLSSILGGIGMAPYCAANAFLDSFAAARRYDGDPTWRSVNWADWRIDPEDLPSALPMGRTTASDFEISTEEGVKTFPIVLSLAQAGQVAVSAGDLRGRYNQWVRLDNARAAIQDASLQNNAAADPASRSALPRNPIEAKVAQVWQELLGVGQIGISDDFFQLGGQSLLGTQIISRLRQIFHVNLPLRTLFDHPTIAGLSEAVVHALNERRAGSSNESESVGQLASSATA